MALIRFIAVALVALVSSASLAAETPPEPGALTFTPSAFYVGMNGGVAWAQERLSHYSEVIKRLQSNLGADSAFGSLHVGYQRGIDAFLVGLAGADYAFDLNQSAGFYIEATRTPTGGSQFDSRGALSGRFGYDFGAFAVYATGGGGTSVAKSSSTAPTASLWSGDLYGATGALGAGLVYKVTRNWAAFSEYRYAEFAQTSAVPDAGVGGAKTTHRFTETSILAGATYRFR